MFRRLSGRVDSFPSCVGGRSALSDEFEHGVEDAVASSRSVCASVTTSFSSSAASGTVSGTVSGTRSCDRNKDSPLSVQVGDSEGQLILLDFELELADGVIDDECVGSDVKLADLTLADVECVWGLQSASASNLASNQLTVCVQDVINLLQSSTS